MRFPRHARNMHDKPMPEGVVRGCHSLCSLLSTGKPRFASRLRERATGSSAKKPVPQRFTLGYRELRVFPVRDFNQQPVKLLHLTVLFILTALMSGCVMPPSATESNYNYSAFRTADPRSILIVPVVNNSVDVDASDYFLSAISQPVAERGYYVFPVNMVKRVMEEDGLADANMVHSADPTRLAELFGADSVLYVSIERWDAQYAVLTTTVTVDFNYVLKDGDTGVILWETDQRIIYQPQSGGSGNLFADLVISAVQAAATKAKPNYLPLARQANHAAVVETHHGLPAGPYRTKEYGLDTDRF